MAILSAPITTRLYGPEAYGVVGVFSSVLAILVSAGAMGYSMALVLPKEQREAGQVARLSMIVALAVSGGLAYLTLLFSDALGHLRGIAVLGNYIYWLPLALLVTTWALIASQWLTRGKDFKSISTITLFNAIWVNAARILAGVAWPTAAALIWIYIVSQGALAMRMTRVACRGKWPNPSNSPASAPVPGRLFEVAVKYRDFPLYRMPQNFINAASQGAPVILLSMLSGPVAAGLYALAAQLMGMPSVLLGGAVANVLYPDMVQRMHAGQSLTSAIVRSTGVLALLGLVPLGGLCLFAPSLFAVVFGEAWRGAGIYCQWLAVFYFFNFINKPAVAAIPALGVQGGLLMYEIASTTVKLGGLYIGFKWFHSDVAAVALYSTTGAVAYLALIAWVIRVSKRQDVNGQAG